MTTTAPRYEVWYLSGGCVPLMLDAFTRLAAAQNTVGFVRRRAPKTYPRIWDREQKRYLFDKELA